MRLNKDPHHGEFVINSYEVGIIIINKACYNHSLIVSSSKIIDNWSPQDITELKSEHITPILSMNPEVVILGTGSKLIFPDQAILAPLYNNNIGVEVMDTQAACRTFNVLMAEDRKAVAALCVK